MSKGWECPKCGSVYAPHVHECDTCKNSKMRMSIGSTKDFEITVDSVRNADQLFRELYRTTQTHTNKVTIAPPPVTLTNGDITKGYAGD